MGRSQTKVLPSRKHMLEFFGFYQCIKQIDKDQHAYN